MAANIAGIGANTDFRRIRLRIASDRHPDDWLYFGLPVFPDGSSPFAVVGEAVTLAGTRFASVTAAENDTCDTTYFRRDDSVLVLNSNSRSTCTGCAFCATHRQDATDRAALDTPPALRAHLERVLSPVERGHRRPHFGTAPRDPMTVADLYQVAVVTGCFGSEDEAVAQLLMTSRELREQGFKGEFLYVGSELEERGIEALARETPSLAVCLTVECLTRRSKLLKPLKRHLTLPRATALLDHCASLGVSAGFTEIIGLDPLDALRRELPPLAQAATRFPIFQVFQPHWPSQRSLRAPGADGLGYYLQARQIIEDLFRGRPLRPRSWENYRSLWSYTFADEALSGIRI